MEPEAFDCSEGIFRRFVGGGESETEAGVGSAGSGCATTETVVDRAAAEERDPPRARNTDRPASLVRASSPSSSTVVSSDAFRVMKSWVTGAGEVCVDNRQHRFEARNQLAGEPTPSGKDFSYCDLEFIALMLDVNRDCRDESHGRKTSRDNVQREREKKRLRGRRHDGRRHDGKFNRRVGATSTFDRGVGGSHNA